MFEATRLHEEIIKNKINKYAFRIGRKVPPNAVNLAYYYNKRMSSESNVLVSEAPKNTIDHITVSTYMQKKAEPKMDDNVFLSSVPYSDDNGYTGSMKRKWVNWEPNDHVDRREIDNHHYASVVTKQVVPETLSHTEGDFSGTLHLQDVTYKKGATDIYQEAVVETKQVSRKMFQGNLPSPSYGSWPNTYTDANGNTVFTEDGFSGKLLKVPGAESYTKKSALAIGNTQTLIKTYDNINNMPSTIVENGITYRREAYEDITQEKFYWGTFNWLGNGGMYGYWTSANANDTGTGYFTDAVPALTGDIFTALRSLHFNDTFPTGGNNYYIGNENGTKWFLDIAESKRFGSSNGHVWASTFWNAAGSLPTKHQPLGGVAPTPYFGNEGSFLKSHLSVVSPSGGSFDSNQALYDPENPTVANRQFRPVIQFLRAYKPGVKVFFVAVVADGSKNEWIGEQLYTGTIKKTTNKNKERILNWRADAVYSGTLLRETRDYDGLAFYEGVAVKRTAVGNINPEGQRDFLMYPDGQGVLWSTDNLKELESELFYITNLFKDNVPLYYACKLKQPIYDRLGPDEFGIYQGNGIKILSGNLKPLSERKYKFQIKLVPHKQGVAGYEDIYDAYVFTSFLTTNARSFKVVYHAYDPSSPGHIAANKTEELSVQPYFELGKDYTVIPTNEKLRRTYIQLMTNPIIEDDRKKVGFRYIVKADDGSYVSEAHYAEAINREYALSVEEKDFINRNYVVSPKESGAALTAFEIIVKDKHLDEAEQAVLRTKTFRVELDLSDPTTASNKKKLNLFTKPDGTGPVSVETTEDTGFLDPLSGKHERMIQIPGMYKLEGGKIYPGYRVTCRDVRAIKTLAPREFDLLSNWYLRVQFGHFNYVLEQHGYRKRYTYAIPEYDKQEYSTTYGRPYVEVQGEVASVLNDNDIKVSLCPMYVKVDSDYAPTNLRVYKTAADGYEKELAVDRWSFTEGVIRLTERISENDRIQVDYVYEEESYVYRGFYDPQEKFIDIEFNPNQYHTYLDHSNPSSRERKKVHDLFNKVVYLFLRPTVIEEMQNDHLLVRRNSVNSFPDVVVYDDDDGFKGTLVKNGASYVESGTYTDAQAKTATATGTTYLVEASVPSTLAYDQDGYRGTLARTSIQKEIIGYNQKKVGSESDYHFEDDLNSPIYSNYSGTYSGEVVKPITDTRIWRQDYKGTVSKEAIYQENTVYHQIDNGAPERDHDILIGSIYVRHNTSLRSTRILDARSRGGGVLEEIRDGLRKELEPESEHYWDIGFWDGEPYTENAVLIVRLDKRILTENGGRFTHQEVDAKVSKWLAHGTLPLIEYVTAYEKEELPESTLAVEEEYLNTFDFTPQAYLSTEES